MAHLESGEFRNARVLIEKLALEEPTNKDAEGAIGYLKEKIETEGTEGLKQIALIAGAVVAVIGVGIWFWKSRSGGGSSSSPSSSEIESVARAAAVVAAPPLPSAPTPASHPGFAKPSYGSRFKPSS
jgi:hypothetical protein